MGTERCFLCETPFTSEDDNTREHIILNAIGGRRRVARFICRSCNNNSGSEWDYELARQLNPLSLLLGITRQSGDVPSQAFPTLSGSRVRMEPDGTMRIGRPEIQETADETITHLHIRAPTKRHLRQVLEGLGRRKYPQLRSIELDDLISHIKEGFHYRSDPFEVTLGFGGTHSGRSLVKSAVALVYDAGVDPKRCDLALNYLLNEDEEPCFGYYYDSKKDLIVDRPSNSVFHCVYVEGCSECSTIVGYIELYSLWRMVLCLSESYTGRDFTHVYAIDPIKGKELNISVSFNLSISDIREAYEYRRVEDIAYHDAISNVMSKVHEIDFNRAMNQAIQKATNDSLVNSQVEEGDIPTDEQVRRLARDIAQEMMPFIRHNMSSF